MKTDIQESYRIYKIWNEGNRTTNLSKEQYEKEYTFFDNVYSILVEYGGACEVTRGDFIYAHLSSHRYPCTEWRFSGKFLFSGKYRKETNSIDYYAENETPELNNLQDKINRNLRELKCILC